MMNFAENAYSIPINEQKVFPTENSIVKILCRFIKDA